MKIVIVRHGDAEPIAYSDKSRDLTRSGVDQAFLAGQCLADLGFNFDRVWVSPYNRAQQTAEQLLKSVPCSVVETFDLLTPDSSPHSVVEAIQQSTTSHLLLVSHQPLVSRLIGLLDSGNPGVGQPMATASMAYLETEFAVPGCFTLNWLRHGPHFEAVL